MALTNNRFTWSKWSTGVQKNSSLSRIVGVQGMGLTAQGLRPAVQTSSFLEPRNFRLSYITPLLQPLELLQKTEIVIKKQPQIVDSILEHSNTFYAHAESISGDFFRIVANHFENLGIHHAGAQNF